MRQNVYTKARDHRKHSIRVVASLKLREAKDATATEPLFPDLPALGEPDEIFTRHGWWRGPATLRQLSQAADPHQPTNLLSNLCALFSLHARAEIMAFLFAIESGHPREIA